MADPRFFKKKGPFTLEQLAEIGQCEIYRGDSTLLVHDVAPLNEADTTCIGVLYNTKYQALLQDTKALACILGEEVVDRAPKNIALLVTKYPHRSFAMIAAAFYPQEKKAGRIDPTAIIDPSAKLGKDVDIGPLAIIAANAELSDGVVVGAYTIIEEGVSIGEKTTIGSHVSISHAIIGKCVNIKPGARIGQSGFGFFMDSGDMGGHVPVPQLGRVLIHDYVEIGANTTIDRGSGADTIIGLGTRIDNLVMVAHNVHFGKGCVMVAQTGIAGSTKLGDYVAAGGQVGIA
ncbi:MAG: UDP-3-O-(3-hydroxymyristoyl)glucosamine N-acyltransferase, partial [Alphaproteobacteria bacterium]|nr:UDP-3-O-(3-hydroxymyristoyl)glucosamine N-acyltransferase [Alphaproteobacteria bacterium]